MQFSPFQNQTHQRLTDHCQKIHQPRPTVHQMINISLLKGWTNQLRPSRTIVVKMKTKAIILSCKIPIQLLLLLLISLLDIMTLNVYRRQLVMHYSTMVTMSVMFWVINLHYQLPNFLVLKLHHSEQPLEGLVQNHRLNFLRCLIEKLKQVQIMKIIKRFMENYTIIK